MLGKIYLFIFLLFLWSACTKDFNPIFSDVPEKLVVFAELDIQNGMKVHLSRTTSTKSPVFTNTLHITDGKVFLIDSISGERINIPHDSNGIYFLKHKIEIKNKYCVEAQYNDKIVKSNWLEIPVFVENSILTRTLIERDVATNRLFKIKYQFEFTAPNFTQYFDFPMYKNKINVVTLPPENYFCKNNLTSVLNTSCDLAKKITWEFGGESLELLYTRYYEPHKGFYYFYISLVSESYYKYLLSIATPKPVEKLFLQPSQSFSNINEGLGIFYIRNSMIDTLSID